LLSELYQYSTREIISYVGETDDQNKTCEMSKNLAEDKIGDNAESRFITPKRHCWWRSSSLF